MAPAMAQGGQFKIVLYDVSGKRIYSASTGTRNGALILPAGGLPAGKYFLSITDGNNRTSGSAFVLTR